MKYMNVGKTAKPINTKGTMRRLFSFMKPYRVRIVLMAVSYTHLDVYKRQASRP